MTARAERRIAVVLFNLGGPDDPASIHSFLFNLFNDRAIIGLPQPFRWMVARLISGLRARSARANYAMMGGGSPLLAGTTAQAQALQGALGARLADGEAKVFIAMRYWHPMTRETVRRVAGFKPDDIVLLPLYPQFSTTTSGSSLSVWNATYKGPGRVRTVCCYPEDTGLVEAHARSILATHAALGRPGPIRLLFSAHGLPQKLVDEGDPYAWQVERTCEAVIARLGPDWAGVDWDWRLCFQSRVGPMKWLGPSTPEALEDAARDDRGALVTPIAFVSEHVETLVELDHDYAGLAREIGLPFYLRAPAIGVDLAFIEGLADGVVAALGRDGVAAEGVACPAAFGKCPYKQRVQPALTAEAA